MDRAAFDELLRETAAVLDECLRRQRSARMRDQMFFRVRELQGLSPWPLTLNIRKPTAYVRVIKTPADYKAGTRGEHRVDVLFDGVQP